LEAGQLSSVFEPNFICRSTSPPAPSPTERGINWKSLSVGEGFRVRFLRELNSPAPLEGARGRLNHRIKKIPNKYKNQIKLII
jgi:hypothetical protein